MSEGRSPEFSGGRRGLPVRQSNAANPKGRVVGVASGLLAANRGRAVACFGAVQGASHVIWLFQMSDE